jgi:hypothetical protein
MGRKSTRGSSTAVAAATPAAHNGEPKRSWWLSVLIAFGESGFCLFEFMFGLIFTKDLLKAAILHLEEKTAV